MLTFYEISLLCSTYELLGLILNNRFIIIQTDRLLLRQR